MQDKKTLITIIVLLAIFLPASIVGTYRSSGRTEDGPTIVDDNPNHDFLYNNKVYFYYNDELIAKYDCVDCTQTTTVIDDNNYHTNYFKDGNYEIPTVLNPNVAIFHQDRYDYVYSVLLGRTISNFDAIKTYRVEHASQILIVRSGDFWGVVTVNDQTLVVTIDYDYEYISLPAHIIDGKLDTSKFIAKRNNYWYILNSDGTSSYPAFSQEIVDFNDNYYITYDNAYHIYNYNNQEFLGAVTKSGVYATQDYIIILNPDNSLSVYQDLSSAEIRRIILPSYTSLYFNETEAGVEIMLDGNLYQTIEQA